MFKLRWPFKRKVRSDYGRPDLDENSKRKTFERQHTADLSDSQPQPLVLIPILSQTEAFQVPPVLQSDEILDKFIRTTNIPAHPSERDLTQVLIQQGFAFDFIEWPDKSSCAIAWPPGANENRELTPEVVLLSYVVARSQLEIFCLHARKQFSGQWWLQ